MVRFRVRVKVRVMVRARVKVKVMVRINVKVRVRVRYSRSTPSGLVPSPSLLQKHSLTDVTSFEVYVSDVDLRK